MSTTPGNLDDVILRRSNKRTLPSPNGTRRKGRRKEESEAEPKRRPPFLRRWMTAGLLLVSALLVVFYVSNAIAVNDLLGKITSVESESDRVRNENERLRAELLRLMSVERITEVASQELGMVQPKQPPIALPLSEDAEAAAE